MPIISAGDNANSRYKRNAKKKQKKQQQQKKERQKKARWNRSYTERVRDK